MQQNGGGEERITWKANRFDENSPKIKGETAAKTFCCERVWQLYDRLTAWLIFDLPYFTVVCAVYLCTNKLPATFRVWIHFYLQIKAQLRPTAFIVLEEFLCPPLTLESTRRNVQTLACKDFFSPQGFVQSDLTFSQNRITLNGKRTVHVQSDWRINRTSQCSHCGDLS